MKRVFSISNSRLITSEVSVFYNKDNRTWELGRSHYDEDLCSTIKKGHEFYTVNPYSGQLYRAIDMFGAMQGSSYQMEPMHEISRKERISRIQNERNAHRRHMICKGIKVGQSITFEGYTLKVCCDEYVSFYWNNKLIVYRLIEEVLDFYVITSKKISFDFVDAMLKYAKSHPLTLRKFKEYSL